MKRFAIAAFAVGSLVAGSASAATNLVSNGSFESGTLDWTYSGSGDDVPNHMAVVIPYNSNLTYPGGAFGEPIPPDNTVSGSPDAVGTHALYFVADHSTETLSQSVFLDVGQYTIGFSVYVPQNGFNNSGNATFKGKVAGVSLANFTVDASSPQTWMHFSGVANVAVAGNYLTEFTYDSGLAPAGDFVVDRAYIVAGDVVPEPSTWALMILGFGSAGAMLRRRREVLVA